MTNHQSDQAPMSATPSNVNPNPRNRGKEKTKMRIKFFVFVALVATFILAGCGDEAPSTTYKPTGYSGEANWPTICESSSTAKPTLCTETLSVTVCYKVGDPDNNGLKDVNCETVEFARTAGELKATAPFAPPPVTAGEYVYASLIYTGITLGEDDVMETCDGASLPSSIELLPGVDETLCIRMVNHDNNTSSTGSGKGNLCVGVTDTNGTVDVSTCVFDVDGNAVTPDADTNGDCPDGALLAGLNAKVSVLAVTCGSEEGSLTTEVAEDSVTDVSVTVEEPNTAPGNTGDLCVSVKDEQAAPLGNCVLDFLQLVTDPTVSGSPPSGCDSAGDYFFTSVKNGLYDIVATCGGLSGQRKVEVVADELQHVWMTLMVPGVDGEFDVGKFGLPIDLDTPSADMAQWLCYWFSGSCVTATPQQLAGMSVLDFSQTSGPGTCTDANDPNCPITVQGLVVSVPSWTEYSTPGEQRVFNVTVEDANQNTVVVYIDTVNGYFQP